VILKSYIVEQDIEILNSYNSTLIYGENEGIKDDIKDAIKKRNNNSEIINFYEDDILKNNYLYESIHNPSLFNEKKIILLHETSDKIYSQIIECLDKENKNIDIYIFSQNLEKKSKLRTFFEKGKKLAIFPCYKDNERTLITYINNELKGFKGLTGEIVNLIINNSNMDRRIIKNELLKIKGFFIEKKIIKNQILEILNIKNNDNFNEIRDKALNGEKEKVNKLLSETEILKEEVFFHLNNLNNRVMRLHEIIEKSNINKENYEQTVENLKPVVFWQDKPIIYKQLKKWDLRELEKIIVKIANTEKLMKKNSYIRNDVVIKDLLINLTNKASTFF
jgi:DNA polymerase-3 subunit delta